MSKRTKTKPAQDNAPNPRPVFPSGPITGEEYLRARGIELYDPPIQVQVDSPDARLHAEFLQACRDAGFDVDGKDDFKQALRELAESGIVLEIAPMGTEGRRCRK